VAAYHQIGHDSENLLFEPGLARFGGAILSPVNYEPLRASAQVARVSEELSANFDVVLDPQLYVPASDRDKLRKWPYFPKDVDTADLSSPAWWAEINGRLLGHANQLKPNGVCSPATLPNADAFTDAYYASLVEIGNDLVQQAAKSGLRVLQTAVVGLKELALESRPLEVASLLSNTKAKEIYLNFFSEVVPRRELAASDQLTGAARLIAEIKKAGLSVLVGCCSADMLIWKAVGADSCATGKFFNLRRFSRSRWGEAIDGGQNIAYFFEEALVAFVREADVRRIHDKGLMSEATAKNPYAAAILEKLAQSPGAPWVGDGWRQYLYWFAECEERISKGGSVDDLLSAAEQLWIRLPEMRLLMDEARNDGAWVRPWRIAALAGAVD